MGLADLTGRGPFEAPRTRKGHALASRGRASSSVSVPEVSRRGLSEMGSCEPKVADVASDERMITEAHGDLLQSDAEALVNAVNTVG